MAKPQPSSGKRRIILLALAGALLLLVAAILFLILRGKPPPSTVREPDYATLDVDAGARPMDNPGAEKAEVTSGGGSVTISFSDDIRYSLSTRTVSLNYQNPYASTHNVALQVILVRGEDEILLAQSGILPPGYELTSLPAEQDLPDLTAGGFGGKLRLLFFDPETGERAILDTDIPCTVTVTE